MRRGAVVLASAFTLVAALMAAPAAEGQAAEPLEAEQWALVSIEAQAAWAVSTGAGTVVAVVDSGVDKDHPEFSAPGKLVGGVSWIDCPGATPCTDPSAWDDENGHGTHVAGIVAAPRNGIGVAGVAPDTSVMPVRVLDENGDGFSDEVAEGVRWAADHGADVINLSLGGLPVVTNLTGATGLDGGFAEALEYAVNQGVLVVAAAGNEAFPICANDAFVSENGLCVGATDPFDLKAWYSNWGPGVEIVAPGGGGHVLCEHDVLSAVPEEVESFCSDPGYDAYAGTSMAAPHVSGVGALLADLGMTGGAAAQQILATAEGLGLPALVPLLGPGHLNAGAAVGA